MSIALSKYSTSIGASRFISYTAFIYQYGLGVFGSVIGYVGSMFILAYYISPKLSKISHAKGFLQMGEIIEYKTGSKTLAKTTNIFGSAINFGWLLVGVSGGANLITYFGLLSYELSLGVMVIVVLGYLLFIGYKGVVSTDIIQAIIIISLLSFISFSMFSTTNIETLTQVKFETISFGTVMGFLIFGLFSVFSFIDRYQLLFSGKNKKNLKKGFLSVIPLIVLSVFLLLIMGYLVRNQFPNIDPAIVFVKAIQTYLPLTLIPLAIVMFFAAVMSSIDSYIFSISSHLNIFNIKDKIKNIKINSILISLFAVIICYFERDIINITTFAAGFSLVLSIPMMYILWGKNFSQTKKIPSRFFFSLLGSLFGFSLGIAIFGMIPSVAIFPLIFGVLGLFIHNNKLDKLLI
ncbi:hypothetical protein LR004_02825 [Candidatus Gracilibacteria bacterium]|nr:hypothetical protein [Candidatus Gracilibacteria bacterium]